MPDLPSKNKLQTAIVGVDLFKSPDFSSLKKAVDRIAGFTGKLSDGEKKQGAAIVDSWSELTHKTLGDELAKINSILSFFGKRAVTGDTFVGNYYFLESNEPAMQSLAALSHTTGLYTAFHAASLKVDAIRKTGGPVRYVEDVNLSIAANHKNAETYRLELAKYESKLSRAEKEQTIARRAWMEAMVKHPDLKAFLKTITDKAHKIVSYEQKIDMTANVAKINISIASAGARDALKELFTFTENL